MTRIAIDHPPIREHTLEDLILVVNAFEERAMQIVHGRSVYVAISTKQQETAQRFADAFGGTVYPIGRSFRWQIGYSRLSDFLNVIEPHVHSKSAHQKIEHFRALLLFLRPEDVRFPQGVPVSAQSTQAIPPVRETITVVDFNPSEDLDDDGTPILLLGVETSRTSSTRFVLTSPDVAKIFGEACAKSNVFEVHVDGTSVVVYGRSEKTEENEKTPVESQQKSEV